MAVSLQMKIHLEDILQKYFQTGAKLASVEGVTISDGTGFASTVMRITLTWSEINDCLPKKVVAKIPKIENMVDLVEVWGVDAGQKSMNAAIHHAAEIHKTECSVYNILMRENPIPIPLVYGYKDFVNSADPGMIVMEDLSVKAGLVDHMATGLTIDQWRSVVEHLADLHAWSLTTDIPWREQFADISLFNDRLKSFSKRAPSAIRRLKEKYAEYFSTLNEEKIIEALEAENLMKKYFSYKQMMPSEMIEHGDTWVNNIFFERNPDGTLGHKMAGLIDWQACHRGPGIYDFAWLENSNINHEIRRANENAMLHIYYDRLKLKAGNKLMTTFEQIEYLNKEALSLNAVITLLMADVILEDIDKYFNDESGWRKVEILNRIKASYDDAAKYYGWDTESSV